MNLIVKEYFDSYNLGFGTCKKKIKAILEENHLDTDILENLEDPFSKAESLLKTEKKRLDYIETELGPYIGPESVLLEPSDPLNRKYYHYVPIKSSLKRMLEDETYIRQQSEDPYLHEEDVFKDMRDGLNFRNNAFFQANTEAIPLVLFSDEFEVCNPIGAGKGKHKINATYFTHGFIQPALRSKVNSIQLVSLVRSQDWKSFGNGACYGRLVKDIKDLEENGITIEKPFSRVVKAGLCYMVGDNLGQHAISEMSECFSSGHICEICIAICTS